MRIIALHMAKYANTIITGDPYEPATWRQALRRIGCDVGSINKPKAGEIAYYMPDIGKSAAYPLGMVLYNITCRRHQRAKALAHEFGHALMKKWVPESFYEADAVYSYHDDPRDVRHRIARMFERMMVG